MTARTVLEEVVVAAAEVVLPAKLVAFMVVVAVVEHSIQESLVLALRD